MSQGIPHDCIPFICSACGTGTWLTKEEATHCAGTQMRCLKCGSDIDIPECSPRARQQRPKIVLKKSEYELTVDAAPVARSPADSLSRSKPGPPAAPRMPDCLPDREGGTRKDRNGVQHVLDSFASDDPGDVMLLPEGVERDATESPPRSGHSRPKKKRKKKTRLQEVVCAEADADTPTAQRKKTVSFHFDAWLPAAFAVGSLVVYAAVAANTVPKGLVASDYVWNKLKFILTVIAIATPALLAASTVLGISCGELKTALFKVPAIVLTQASAEDLLTLQPLPYVPTFGAWAVTLFLVMNAFDLEGLEAQIVMCLVRGTHSAVYWTMFVGLLTAPDPVPGQNWMFQPQLNQDIAPNRVEEPAKKPWPGQKPAPADDPHAGDASPGNENRGNENRESDLVTVPRKPPARSMDGEEPGQEREDNALKIMLVWCPPGEFKMGSPKSEQGRRDDREAQVAVALTNGFWLGKYEVTQSEWKDGMGSEPWKGQKNTNKGDNYPATWVTWEDAMNFCRQFTDRERAAGRLPVDWEYTLPTEAQWEYACRAGTQTAFHFGDGNSKLGEYAWYLDNTSSAQEEYPHEACQKKPNSWGFHDMHGNVFEWCRDRFVSTLPGGIDPEVTEGESNRVIRSSGFLNAATDCRSARRGGSSPSRQSYQAGFRVALCPGPP